MPLKNSTYTRILEMNEEILGKQQALENMIKDLATTNGKLVEELMHQRGVLRQNHQELEKQNETILRLSDQQNSMLQLLSQQEQQQQHQQEEQYQREEQQQQRVLIKEGTSSFRKKGDAVRFFTEHMDKDQDATSLEAYGLVSGACRDAIRQTKEEEETPSISTKHWTALPLAKKKELHETALDISMIRAREAKMNIGFLKDTVGLFPINHIFQPKWSQSTSYSRVFESDAVNHEIEGVPTQDQ